MAKAPHGHWKTLTFVAALRCDRIEAPLVFDGPINGQSFAAYVEQALAPTLNPGDIVVLDNLRSHKGAAIRATIRAAGAKLFFLPPYSPDLNPIEQVFAKLKHLMRNAAERTVETTWRRIGSSLPDFYPPNAQTTSGTPDMLPYESSRHLTSLAMSKVTTMSGLKSRRMHIAHMNCHTGPSRYVLNPDSAADLVNSRKRYEWRRVRNC